jgi:HK97 family phage major capsid protein
MDSAALRGDGSGANPTGLLSLTNAANKFAALGALAPTLAQLDTGKRTAQLRLAQANIPVRRRRWLMSNRVFMFLKDVRDSNGNKAYPSLENATPTWDGIPVLTSEQVPSNLGGTTDESEIYLVDFGHFLVGIARALVLNSSTEASYNDGVGVRSAFQRDQTVIRALASHDFDVRYDKASAVITGVRWGA